MYGIVTRVERQDPAPNPAKANFKLLPNDRFSASGSIHQFLGGVVRKDGRQKRYIVLAREKSHGHARVHAYESNKVTGRTGAVAERDPDYLSLDAAAALCTEYVQELLTSKGKGVGKATGQVGPVCCGQGHVWG